MAALSRIAGGEENIGNLELKWNKFLVFIKTIILNRGGICTLLFIKTIRTKESLGSVQALKRPS